MSPWVSWNSHRPLAVVQLPEFFPLECWDGLGGELGIILYLVKFGWEGISGEMDLSDSLIEELILSLLEDSSPTRSATPSITWCPGWSTLVCPFLICGSFRFLLFPYRSFFLSWVKGQRAEGVTTALLRHQRWWKGTWSGFDLIPRSRGAFFSWSGTFRSFGVGRQIVILLEYWL